MNTKKKIIIIATAAVLVLALIITGTILILKSSFSDKGTDTSSVSSLSDEPVGEAVITVGSVSGSVGEKIKVPVEISGNPGFMAAFLKFEYDTSSLKYVTYHKGDFLTDYEVYEDSKAKGKISFINTENGDVSDNGVMLYLEFEILEGAKSSDVKIVTDSDTMLCNYDEQIISIKGTDGTVTVK